MKVLQGSCVRVVQQFEMSGRFQRVLLKLEPWTYEVSRVLKITAPRDWGLEFRV